MQKIVLINGRFELLNSRDKVEVYDIRNLNKDANGKLISLEVIPIGEPMTDKDAGKIALKRLQESGYISVSEYLTFLDIFLASLIDGVSYRNVAMSRKSANDRGESSRPE